MMEVTCVHIAKLVDVVMPLCRGRGRSTVAAGMNFVFSELEFFVRTGLRAQYLACVCGISVSASQMFLSISSPVVLSLFLLSLPCLSSFFLRLSLFLVFLSSLRFP